MAVNFCHFAGLTEWAESAQTAFLAFLSCALCSFCPAEWTELGIFCEAPQKAAALGRTQGLTCLAESAQLGLRCVHTWC
jgi:hypothetical protein